MPEDDLRLGVLVNPFEPEKQEHVLQQYGVVTHRYPKLGVYILEAKNKDTFDKFLKEEYKLYNWITNVSTLKEMDKSIYPVK